MSKKKPVKKAAKPKLKPKPDFFQNAIRIVEEATGERLAKVPKKTAKKRSLR